MKIMAKQRVPLKILFFVILLAPVLALSVVSSKVHWTSTKIACDLRGGAWNPKANNCNTLAGATKFTCEITKGCSWKHNRFQCPRQRKDFICQLGCECSKNWWTGICTCTGTYISGIRQ